jgi:hypothetical protein
MVRIHAGTDAYLYLVSTVRGQPTFTAPQPSGGDATGSVRPASIFFLRNQGVLYGETAGIGGSVPTRGLRQRDPARRQIKKPGDRAWKGKA